MFLRSLLAIGFLCFSSDVALNLKGSLKNKLGKTRSFHSEKRYF